MHLSKVAKEYEESISSSASFDDIVGEADKVYNDKVNLYEIGSNKPENLV